MYKYRKNTSIQTNRFQNHTEFLIIIIIITITYNSKFLVALIRLANGLDLGPVGYKWDLKPFLKSKDWICTLLNFKSLVQFLDQTNVVSF